MSASWTPSRTSSGRGWWVRRISSSVAKLLKDKGLRIAPIKMEGYLNVDSGTLNPYRHGEVFVLDDGGHRKIADGPHEEVLADRIPAPEYLLGGARCQNRRSGVFQRAGQCS